jgi:hypothetical protein
VAGRNLKYAEDAASRLSQFGHAEVSYVTAAFEPHSSTDRPDLLFYPHSGANSGRLFFVEMRIELARSGNPPNVASLIGHRAFVQEEMPDTQLYYAVAVESLAVYHDAWPELLSHGIKVLEPVSSGPDLAEAVRSWSDTALPDPWTPGT